jgi:histidyl-tRNA synthetase
MGRPKKLTPNVEKAPQRLPGSVDLTPEQYLSWEAFWEKLAALAHIFNYSQVQAPMFEDARLFAFWSEGPSSLFSMVPPKGHPIAAAPTGVFGLARIFLEHQATEPSRVVKWCYSLPVARFSEGVLKQTIEYGFQVFGPLTPIADAQLINLLFRLYGQMGLTNLSLEINSVGCLECLPAYEEQLKAYLKDKKYDLCESCIGHLEAGHPLQVFACKNLSCSTTVAEAPAIIDHLCENCRKQLIAVLEGLDELGIGYNLNPHVIGSSWSRRTVFEIRCRFPQEELVLGTGGHADELIQSLGGVPSLALGFSSTQAVITRALDLANLKFAAKTKVDVFLVPLGDLAAKKTLRLFTELWNNEIIASEFVGSGSIKNQLKLAESSKVSIALIIGQKEAREGTVILRDVRSGMQELFLQERIVDEVKKRLGR